MATPPLPALTTTLASSSKNSDYGNATPDTAVEAANARAFTTNRITQVESVPHFLTLSRLDIAAKFQELEWKQRFRLAHAHQNPTISPYVIDRTNDILLRNRYGNIQPWAKSRIRLRVPDGHCDYINASPIALKNTSDSSVETKYIATQGPKENQFSHFWNMVMEETADPAIIIMLTQTHEGNREKCAQYFPISMEQPKVEFPSLIEEPSMNSQDGFLTPKDEFSPDEVLQPMDDAIKPVSPETSGFVTLNSLSNPQGSSRYAFRDMTLKISNRSKTVYHYLFPSWADFSKPEAEDRQSLIELMQNSATRCGKIAENARIVHCSAGVGRTGTFIAVDHLLRELENGALDSSKPFAQDIGENSVFPDGNGNTRTGDNKTRGGDLIFDTVNALREQRMLMVMNELQYSFIYDVLKEAWEKRHLHGKRKPEPESLPPPVPSTAKEAAATTENSSTVLEESTIPIASDLKVDTTDHPPPTPTSELEGRSPKVARKTEGDGGVGAEIYRGTKMEEGSGAGPPVSDEDTVSVTHSDDEEEEFLESREQWEGT